jgi:hypothetical protein
MSLQQSQSALSAAVIRMAVPVLVFGTVFFVAMLGLQYLASPDRFPVRVGDKVIKLQDLSNEEATLREREQVLLQERAKMDADMPTPVLHQVATLRSDDVAIVRALNAVEQARAGFAMSGDNPVRVSRVWFSRGERRLAIAGQVADPAGRSVHLLASFVDALRSSKSFASVSEPEYTQQTQSDGIVTSPFSLSLSLPVRDE